MDENFEKYCRICLDVESHHVSVLEDSSVHLHLKSCLSINVSSQDNLPKVICYSCAAQLEDFYNFQLNARCSQDWLESSIHEKNKQTEPKMLIQPLPDSEYNSDSLLEFLNNTANIEEYLNNLGKEDIPSIVNMLDKNTDSSMDQIKAMKSIKSISPKKKEIFPKSKQIDLKMDIDVLDSDVETVKEILMKKNEVKPKKVKVTEKNFTACFACKLKCDSIQKLAQHTSICDLAHRTCTNCNLLFDSKQKLLKHRLTHTTSLPVTCNCGKQFHSKEKLTQHYKICNGDYITSLGCSYRCKRCGEEFKQRYLLYNHAKKHVEKDFERVCDICGHTFLGDEALAAHKKDEHNLPSNVSFRCKVCGFTSPNHKEIYLHAQKHTLKKEQTRHLCETCGQSFSTLATMMRHTLQHGNNDYKCNVCNKAFANEVSKKKHILKHSEVFMCEKCGQTVYNSDLNGHSCIKFI